MSPRTASAASEWLPVCRLADLDVARGVAALVHGHAVALFRVAEETVYALGNHDPFAKASMMARGIVGERAGVPFVASPVHRHAFDLRSGRCLDDTHVSVPAYPVRIEDGVVLVGSRKIRPDQAAG